MTRLQRLFDAQSMRWIVAELVIVVLGIMIAFQLDGLREQAGERGAETEALEVLQLELQDDSVELAVYREQLVDLERRGALALESIDDPALPADTLATRLADATDIWNFRPSRSAFEGLRDSGRLNLIRDVELLGEILSYYDDAQVYADDLRANVRSAARAANARLYRHVRWVPSGGGWSEGRVRLSSSRQEVAADAELLGLLGEVAQSGSWLALRIEELFIPENAYVRALIRDALGSGD